MKEVDKIKEKIVPILKENKVTKAGVFGSFARGEQRKKSDVDILIEIDGGTDLLDLAHLKGLLERRLKRKVDLVEYSCIREELKSNILNDQIQIL